MRERTSSTSVTEDAEVPAPTSGAVGSSTPAPALAEPAFVTASHELLYATDAVPRCDICGAEVTPDEDDGPRLAGAALYVSARGDRVLYDEPPLCHECAVAVGVTALQRWDLEEEEG